MGIIREALQAFWLPKWPSLKINIVVVRVKDDEWVACGKGWVGLGKMCWQDDRDSGRCHSSVMVQVVTLQVGHRQGDAY